MMHKNQQCFFLIKTQLRVFVAYLLKLELVERLCHLHAGGLGLGAVAQCILPVLSHVCLLDLVLRIRVESACESASGNFNQGV